MSAMRKLHPGFRVAGRRTAGFSMIEVLIALVVLAIGLLGFALLQTMNLRFTQSANYRTQATNLAYDLLDQMRANRFQAAWYAGSTGASFNAGEIEDIECSRPMGAVTIQASSDRWKCQVARTLGPSASANVSYASGVVRVEISWGDHRWEEGSAATSFALTTRL